MNEYQLYFDGCSKGNPGRAGAGAVIYSQGQEIWSGYAFVGNNETNNQAEYNGLLLGMEKAVEMQWMPLQVYGDSLLVIKQMEGKYKCDSTKLIPLFRQAKEMERNLSSVSYTHVERKLNKRADELSNMAVHFL